MTLPIGSLSRPRAVSALLARVALGLLALGICLLVGGRDSHAQHPLADSSAWEPLGEPLEIEGFGFSGDPEAPLIWADGQGLWTIQDITGSWTRTDDRGSGHTKVLLYGPDPATPDTIFAGAPIWRSVDGGETFVRLKTPASPGESQVIGSSDTGYDRIPPGAPHAWRFVAFDDNTFLFSDNGGDTWAAADNTPFLIAFSVKALRSGRVIAAGFHGAVRSDDGGVTWNHIPQLYDTTGIRFDLHNITVLPGLVTGQPGDSEDGRIVLTGTSTLPDGGALMWWSDDDGQTWSKAPQPGNAGCNNGVDIVPLVAETGRPEDVVAVTCQGQVLLSEDGAMTWTPIGHVPGVSGDTLVLTGALGPDGRLYVGTAYSGPSASYSYRTKWRAHDGFVVASGERPERGAFRLILSPNPSQQRVEITLSGSAPEWHYFVVVDSIGREIARTELKTGTSWQVDVSTWAPGVYHASVVGDRQLGGVVFTVVR